MKKLLTILITILLFPTATFAEQLSNEFINKSLSNNDVFKKFKERSDIMKNFFSGSVNIKGYYYPPEGGYSFEKDIKFYYAGREDTKSGQFYIFYIKENNPVILISEEATFFIKELSQIQTFAPRSVEISDLNNDGLNEIILKGKNWGTGSSKNFGKAYFLLLGEKKPIFKGTDYSVKIN